MRGGTRGGVGALRPRVPSRPLSRRVGHRRHGGARDLADALYAELFGLTSATATRRSHFDYFHGRSSLATWLRAVLAQRIVDRARAQRRLAPLPDEESARRRRRSQPARSPDHGRFVALIRAALAAAVGRLAPRDRLRSPATMPRSLTLAQIGRALGEHEATVSRQLAQGAQERARRTSSGSFATRA